MAVYVQIVVYHDHVIARSLPIAERESEDWIHPSITCGWINRRPGSGRMKEFVWPQYLVEPQHVEGKGGNECGLH